MHAISGHCSIIYCITWNHPFFCLPLNVVHTSAKNLLCLRAKFQNSIIQFDKVCSLDTIIDYSKCALVPRGWSAVPPPSGFCLHNLAMNVSIIESSACNTTLPTQLIKNYISLLFNTLNSTIFKNIFLFVYRKLVCRGESVLRTAVRSAHRLRKVKLR